MFQISMDDFRLMTICNSFSHFCEQISGLFFLRAAVALNVFFKIHVHQLSNYAQKVLVFKHINIVEYLFAFYELIKYTGFKQSLVHFPS